MSDQEGVDGVTALSRDHYGIVPGQPQAGEGQAHRRGGGADLEAAWPEPVGEGATDAEETRVTLSKDTNAASA